MTATLARVVLISGCMKTHNEDSWGEPESDKSLAMEWNHIALNCAETPSLYLDDAWLQECDATATRF